MEEDGFCMPSLVGQTTKSKQIDALRDVRSAAADAFKALKEEENRLRRLIPGNNAMRGSIFNTVTSNPELNPETLVTNVNTPTPPSQPHAQGIRPSCDELRLRDQGNILYQSQSLAEGQYQDIQVEVKLSAKVIL